MGGSSPDTIISQPKKPINKCTNYLHLIHVQSKGEDEKTWNTTKSFLSWEKEEKIIKLQRPNSNLQNPRTFHLDQVVNEHEKEHFIQNNILPIIKTSSYKDDDIFLLTYGMQHAEMADSCQKLAESIFSNATNIFGNLDNYRNNSNKNDLERLVLSFSMASAPGDDTDRIFDCLSFPAKNSSISTTGKTETPKNFVNLRIREDPIKGFYLQNQNQVIISNVSEIESVLRKGHEFLRQQLSPAFPRLHTIYTFNIHHFYTNGDSSLSFVQMLNLCPMERNRSSSTGVTSKSNTNTQKSTLPKHKSSNARLSLKRKDDKTMKAFHRVVDAHALLQNQRNAQNNQINIDAKQNSKHYIPYRDSKITRLIQNALSGTRTHLISLFSIFVDEHKYDEIVSLCEFLTQIGILSRKDLNVQQTSKRQKNSKERIQCLQKECQKIGNDLNMQVSDLKSHDIELDMTSSMDLVNLRSLLKEMEDLQVDHIIELENKSNGWWNQFKCT